MTRNVSLCVVAVVVASVLATVAVAVPSGATLKRVVLTHRHGARTPTENVDGACDKLGCGTLTEQGALMLVSLGKAFRQRYGEILPNDYDVTSIKTTSDSVNRCIQSASAFLTGLFAYNASYDVFPATHAVGTKPYAIDPWEIPTFKLHTILEDAGIILYYTKEALSILPKDDVIAIGKELKMNSLECELAPAGCIAEAMDFLSCAEAAGTIGNYPTLQKHTDQLRRIRAKFFHLLEHKYDQDVKKNSFFSDAGFPAGLLGQDIIASAKAEGVVLTEYSGHDTTVMPLWTAMGNYSWAYPVFATAAILEVYEVANSTSGHPSLWVKSIVGVCDQLPGTHPYTFSPYEMVCQDESGNQYNTTSGCPLSHWENFMNTRVTSSSRGVCYAWPEDLKNNLCDSDSAADPKVPCGQYRKACPLDGCGEGKYMTSDLACHKL